VEVPYVNRNSAFTCQYLLSNVYSHIITAIHKAATEHHFVNAVSFLVGIHSESMVVASPRTRRLHILAVTIGIFLLANVSGTPSHIQH
jgi:hypothetical protein